MVQDYAPIGIQTSGASDRSPVDQRIEVVEPFLGTPTIGAAIGQSRDASRIAASILDTSDTVEQRPHRCRIGAGAGNPARESLRASNPIL